MIKKLTILYQDTIVHRAETVELAAAPFETLSEWCEYTRSGGLATSPNVGGSLVGDPVRGVEA
jgi:hypothetical protein